MAVKKGKAPKTGIVGKSVKVKPGTLVASSAAKAMAKKKAPAVKKPAGKASAPKVAVAPRRPEAKPATAGKASAPAKPAAARPAAKPVVAKLAAKPVVAKSAAKPAAAKPATKPAAAKPAAAKPQKPGVVQPQPVVPAAKSKKRTRKEDAIADADDSASPDVRETQSTISTGGGAADATSSVLRDHADIAKGIAERKAAAKAKNIARFSRPAVEKSKNLKQLTDKQSREYGAMLLRLRDEISRQIAYLRGASLTRSDEVNVEEDGSDAFERQLALKLASNEGDAIFEIDEALQRIKEGNYGICQDCGCVISPARLKALPFARRCVACKAVVEKNRDVNDRRYF
jgi:RNA polymerase-binding transcription factor DksA